MAITAWAAKFCHQLDLLVGERPHLLAVDGDDADQLVVLEHRNDKQRSGAAESLTSVARRIAIDVGLIGSQIGNVHDLFGRAGCGQSAVPAVGRITARASAIPAYSRWRIVQATDAEHVSLVADTSVPNLASQMRVAFSSIA